MDADLFYEAMDPSQFMFWDKEDRPYYLMNDFNESDSDSEAIPGAVLSAMLKSQRPRRHGQQFRKDSQQCKFFLQGNCRYGNQCRFKHPSADESQKKADKCIFFQRGYCRYGSSCHFKHATSSLKSQGTSSKQVNKQDAIGRHSDFSPSAEDVSACRLTRIRICFDLPVSGSVPWEKSNHCICYFIEVFVDKREDDVQYLYEIVEKKVNHPFYGPGMFQLHKPGTSMDLTDRSQKLKNTSIFIFGSCIDAHLIQSFSLASRVLVNDTMQDPQRYAMSKLSRNSDGSFARSDLKALLKHFQKPDQETLTSEFEQLSLNSEEDDNNEPASIYHIDERVGQHLREHSKDSCAWCSEKGCQCLSRTGETESDDSERSYQSKTSDSKKDCKRNSKSKGSFECGVYPNTLPASNVPCDNALAFGDIVCLGECPKATLYIVGDSGMLIKLQSDDFVHIPHEISSHMNDPVQKYQRLMIEASSDIGDMMAVSISNDDSLIQKNFGGNLPALWNCSAVLKRGLSATDVQIHFYRIFIDREKYFDAVTPTSELSKDGYYVTNLEEIFQRLVPNLAVLSEDNGI